MITSVGVHNTHLAAFVSVCASRVIAACSLPLLSDISDSLCDVSHPTSQQFCPEIVVNCNSISLFLLDDSVQLYNGGRVKVD